MAYMSKLHSHASEMEAQVSVVSWPDACRNIKYIRCFCCFLSGEIKLLKFYVVKFTRF